MVRNCASGIGLPDRNIAITKGHCGRIGLHYKMARWNSCLKQIVTTRLFGLGIAIIVLPLSAIKNQKPCKLSLKTEAKSVLKANKYSQITMQNGEIKISYRSSDVTTEWIIKNPVSIGILTKAVPGFDFPLEYTWFFIAISDGWGAGMLVFPYGQAGSNLVIGQYDKASLKWRWTIK